jgi:ferredoxin
LSNRLVVDPIACTGHGLCADLFPERIALDDWGYPIIDATAVPPDLREHAIRAVRACPTIALRLERAGQAASTRGAERPGSDG